MAFDKGLFRDDDRYTRQHEEMCSYLLDNAQAFVRFYLGDLAVSPKVLLEEPVTGTNGYLFGYADFLMEYKTDQGVCHKVLIEAKSSISDIGSILRQIKTYKKYLSGVTKVCLVHSDVRYNSLREDGSVVDDQALEREGKVARYFVSQGIYFDFLPRVRNDYIEGNYYRANVPNGRRAAILDWIEFNPKYSSVSMQITSEFSDLLGGQSMTDSFYACEDFPFRKDFKTFLERSGALQMGEDPMEILNENIEAPCWIDFSRPPMPGFGWPDFGRVSAVHAGAFVCHLR